MLAMIDRLGFVSGQQVDAPRPEYSARYREAFAAAQQESSASGAKQLPLIEKQFDHAVNRQTGIIIAGSAGQKIRSAATLFAQGAMFAGLSATQKDDYPITVQTGHSVAEIIVSPETIEYTGIHDPDYFLVISEDGLKRTRAKIEALPATCKLYADEALELPETKAQVRSLPLKQIARAAGKRSVIAGALGAVLADSGMYPVTAFGTAVDTFQRREIAEINGKAIAEGVRLV